MSGACLFVSIGDTPIDPALALTSWIAFKPQQPGCCGSDAETLSAAPLWYHVRSNVGLSGLQRRPLSTGRSYWLTVADPTRETFQIAPLPGTSWYGGSPNSLSVGSIRTMP
jgi:hypothetical protein